MKVSKKLESEGLWASITDEEIRNLVRATLEEIAGDYRDGSLASDGRESIDLRESQGFVRV